MTSLKPLLLLFLLFLLPQLILAQKETKKRLTVGLVLSGGGAKGYAHIGVLRVLEHAGIKIDYIAGTSMGAIVGGLYASGYNAYQLEEIIQEIDFNSILFKKKQRKFSDLHDKTYKEKYAIELELDEQFKPKIPQGISSAHAPLEILSKHLKHVHEVTDYSQLSIPFVCIGTDVETGEAHIFDTGFLPESITASAAYPSLIEPITINGTMYIDGGISNNFPVDVLREKVDIIIGVDVSGELYTKEEITSVATVIDQITSYNMVKKTKSQYSSVDILIRPNIEGVGITDFSLIKTILDAGETAAILKLKELNKLGSNYTNEGLTINPKNNYILISRIETSGLTRFDNEYIKGKLKINPPTLVYYDDLLTKIDELYSSNDFKKISHKIIPTKAPENTLVLDFKETNITKKLKLGFHYNNVHQFGLLANITYYPDFIKNGSLSFDLILGNKPRYEFNFYKNNGYLPSFGLNARFNNFENAFQDYAVSGVKEITYQTQIFTHQLFAEKTIYDQVGIGLGLEHQYVLSKTKNLSKTHPLEELDRSHYINPYAYIRVDNLDNAYFPTKGLALNLRLRHNLTSSSSGNEGATSLELKTDYATPLTSWFSLVFSPSFGTFIGVKTPPTIYQYHIGGSLHREIQNTEAFYGLVFAEASGNYKIMGKVKAQFNPVKNHYLSLIANAALLNKYIDQFNLNDIDYFGFGASYGFKSLIGPLELTYAYSPEVGLGKFYINIGYSF